jgi:redox-sensitive bicupin YhaK (pirin superfamily)
MQSVIHGHRRSLGSFEVERVLPHPLHRMVGPFIFFDHLGPVALPRGLTREADVRPHPHIGLATVTYLFEGEIMHRDSTGIEQAIRPHEVNWMTAGRGITHSERFERARREGGPIHALQAWVALPDEAEETEPVFAHREGADLPEHTGEGVSLRVLAGEAFGLRANVDIRSPLFYVHASLRRGATLPLPAGYAEHGVYVVSGVGV